MEPSNKPTNKVLAAAVSTTILLIVSQFTPVDKDIEHIVNVVVPIILAWRVKNAPTPGGVPLKPAA